mmetsp:Transcript_7286/g.25161  ORF Transcript_7286/g.25161 Transcript_7286/m.25161 type:complete len:89 (+) Transcript_7286:157-423(+)
MPVTPEHLEKALRERLAATDVLVLDTSADRCGSSYDVAIVSSQFEGKKLLDRHRLVNDALKDEMKEIHALSIKKVWTPEQEQAHLAKQ